MPTTSPMTASVVLEAIRPIPALGMVAGDRVVVRPDDRFPLVLWRPLFDGGGVISAMEAQALVALTALPDDLPNVLAGIVRSPGGLVEPRKPQRARAPKNVVIAPFSKPGRPTKARWLRIVDGAGGAA